MLVTKIINWHKNTRAKLLMVAAMMSVALLFNTGIVYADTCGESPKAVTTSIEIGCKGAGNPIIDMLFAFIRFLSIGVGFAIIISIIVAGIQYTASRGDPQATAKALERVRETFIALLIFVFAYAIINWLVPSGLLR